MSGGAYICKIFARAARAQRALYFYIVYPIYAPGNCERGTGTVKIVY